MKSLFVLMLVAWSALSLHAERIDRSTAQLSAQHFLSKKGKKLSATHTPQSHNTPSKQGNAENGDAGYYVFNAAGKQGYVVVSADSRTERILGYADVGSFDMHTAPAHVKAFLQSYADQMAQLAQTTPQQATRRKTMALEPAKRAITPLLSTLWNQNTPYNNLMPDNTTYRPAAPKHFTGCVATAMAQVLYYYKAPAATTGQIASYTSEATDFSGEYKKPVQGYPAHTSIDWSQMKPIYGASYTDGQANAVAQLMAMCSASVRSRLYYKETTAALSEAGRALKENFGYDASTRYVMRSAYNSREWFELMYAELEAGRPVIYGGQSSEGGHAFVLDGFDGEGYFHINWGWGGLANGYFRLSVMNPDATGIGASPSNGFSTQQEAIVGLRPAGSSELPIDESYYRLTYDDCKVVPNATTSELELSCDFINRTSWGGLFWYGWGILKNDGSVEGLVSSSVNIGINYMVDNVAFPELNQRLKNRGEGSYKLVPISRRSNSDVWLPACDVNLFSVRANVTSTSVSYQLVSSQAQLSLKRWDFVGTKVVFAPLEFKMTLQNQGDFEYNGPLYLWRKDRLHVIEAQGGVVVPAGATVQASLSLRMVDQGTFVYQVSTDLSRTHILGETTVTIAPHTPGAALEVVTVNIEGSDNTSPTATHNVLAKRVKASVVIKNNGAAPFGNAIQIGLLAQKAPGSTQYEGSDVRTFGQLIQVGQTGTFEVVFDMVDTRKNYLLKVLSQDATVTNDYTPITFIPCATMTKTDGTMLSVARTTSYTVPADVVVADFTSVSGMTFTPSSNPNTIYLMPTGSTLPSHLVGKNVVHDGETELLTITDGYPFLNTMPITAQRIVYRRPISQGTAGDGRGWQTIALPFAPQRVNVVEDNRDIIWRKQEGDDGRFWLRRFVGVDGNTCHFADAQEFEAFTPYIVAFPGTQLGSLSLVGKTLEFSADQQTVPAQAPIKLTTSSFSFIGTTTGHQASQHYVLNAAGDSFTLMSSSAIAPFRASFKATGPSVYYAPALRIGHGGNLTGIHNLRDATNAAQTNTDGATTAVCNLAGQRVGTATMKAGVWQLPTLPQGVYVVNGQRVLVAQ